MANVTQGEEVLNPKPSPSGYLAKTSLVNHAAPSFGKQTFKPNKTTPGKLGQTSRLSQSVSSLRRKGALA